MHGNCLDEYTSSLWHLPCINWLKWPHWLEFRVTVAHSEITISVWLILLSDSSCNVRANIQDKDRQSFLKLTLVEFIPGFPMTNIASPANRDASCLITNEVSCDFLLFLSFPRASFASKTSKFSPTTSRARRSPWWSHDLNWAMYLGTCSHLLQVNRM